MRRYCETHDAITEHVWKEPSGSECVLCLRGRARRNVSFVLVFGALVGLAAILLTMRVVH